MAAAAALDAILRTVQRQPSLRIALESAAGHVLAEEITAAVPLPPWTNASMDGYALHADEVRNATSGTPARLRIVATTSAGMLQSAPLARGEAVRIFTGAPVPAGADSVIRQEDTRIDGDDVLVLNARDAGRNVRDAGGDVQRGDVVLQRGQRLGPHQLAVLAALGETQPLVYRRPRVAILATGDEIVPSDQVELIRRGERLADVNSVALAALSNAVGGVATPLGIAPDTLDELVAAIDRAGDADLLITAGGVSVGDHDHIRAAMRQLGATQLFHRVAMRPGGPTTYATMRDGRGWLALPGNPVSAMVTFELFGRAVIRAMSGDPQPVRPRSTARLATSVRCDATLEQFVRCAFSGDGVATLTGPQGSGMLMSVVRADGLAVIPPGSGEIPAGAEVVVIRWNDFSES